MENYRQRLRQRLAEQKEALEKDIDRIIELIKESELVLEQQKERKRLAFKELRSIEKKLSKLN